MKKIFLDGRYWIYHLFTALVVASLLLAEDIFEGGEQPLDMIIDFVTDIPLFFVMITSVSMCVWWIIKILNGRLPWGKALWKRFIAEMCALLFVVVVLTISVSYVGRTFDLLPEDRDMDFGFEILTLIMFFLSTFMTISFHEFMNLTSDKQFLEFKASRLEKQNYIIKYEALKSQINPHFLFNSLNVLSSLIYQDTKRSDEFIKKFSEVFRYVLELNQEQLVLVKQELKFLDSYLFLQKIRYGKGLIINKNVASEALNRYIPPLSLQLVVENAIKHNEISNEQQLNIDISGTSESLVVTNDFQPRSNINGSTGIGQQNLIEKFQMINELVPKFEVQSNQYVVTLPLIEKHTWKEF